jgi:hypothetical protein
VDGSYNRIKTSLRFGVASAIYLAPNLPGKTTEPEAASSVMSIVNEVADSLTHDYKELTQVKV